MNQSFFDDVPVLGRMSPSEAAAKLRELGEDEEAAALETAQREAVPGETFAIADWIPFRERAWKHTAHAFGYLAPAEPGNAMLPIRHAGNIAADTSLKNSGIVSKPVQKLVGRLTLFQGISQVLSHRKTT